MTLGKPEREPESESAEADRRDCREVAGDGKDPPRGRGGAEGQKNQVTPEVGGWRADEGAATGGEARSRGRRGRGRGRASSPLMDARLGRAGCRGR